MDKTVVTRVILQQCYSYFIIFSACLFVPVFLITDLSNLNKLMVFKFCSNVASLPCF